ncbi:MAG: YeeE/YedE family protein [Burkholderiales bacterium]|nr:YeeE/YedE family protein [Burkholderiales bacterium]
MNEITPAALAPTVAWLAFALAFVFGVVAQRSNFCTMGAVSDIVNIGDWTRMRMWLAAIAVAIAGAQGLHLAGAIDLGKSIYVGERLNWLSCVIGGACFGVGMTLASGCGSKTLLRVGSGNLKSLIVLLMLAITAYMTLRGVFGVWRVAYLDPVSVTLAGSQDLPSLLARLAGIERGVARVAATLLIAAALLAFCLRSGEFRRADNLVSSVIIGLVITGGWYVSGRIGYLSEDPNTLQEAFAATNSGRMESFSFVAPVAYTLELLMMWSDKSRIVTFGVAATLGVVAGSLAWSLYSRTFRLESFRDAEDTLNHLAGGALMGFGGVTALGCTVGQGLTGISTLAAGSFVTLAAIVAGSVAAFRYQVWRIERSA